MWYLLRCTGETEEDILRQCREQPDGHVLEDAFRFTYDRVRRYEGSWHKETVSIFPGFICLESNDEKGLSRYLIRHGLLQDVHVQASNLLPVREEEQAFLNGLGGAAHHISFSRGVIRGGSTLVTAGPLKGCEGMITRIDRHKRLAYLKTSHLPETLCVKAGLEITEKSM